MEQSKINVLIIDDHQLIIDGIIGLLQDQDDIGDLYGANNMEEAIDVLREKKVNVALIDISIPGSSGIEITRKVLEISPCLNTLALTMHEDIKHINEMIEAGASGYIFKRTSMDEVLEAIRTVARKEKYLGSNVQAVLMDNMRYKNSMPEPGTANKIKLTVREKEILELIAREMNNEEIAEKLFISERTVEAHRRNIFTKTKTKSIVGLIKFAIRNQLVDLKTEN